MTLRCASLVALFLAVNAAHAEQLTVRVHSLKPGQTFTIQTEDRFYRGQLVNGDTGETLMAASWDGTQYSNPRTVYLLGSTHGRSAETGKLMLVSMHQIKPGMCLELGMGSLEERDRRLTSHVVSVNVQ